MGHPGLDPETALQLIQTFFYCIACILGGAMLLGLSAYLVFLCSEIFSVQRRPETRPSKVPHPIVYAPVAEENLGLSVAETPILAEPESLDPEAVGAHALPHDAQTPVTPVHVTLESKPGGPWGFLKFLRFRRAVAARKRRSGLRANAQLEKPA